MGEKEELVLKFARNRLLAHSVLFKHRHPDATPPFHHEIVTAWHSPRPRVLTKAFRGGAKSTLAEEVIAIEAAMGLLSNGIVIGSSFERAEERLRSVKHEIENNEWINTLFGDLKGGTWNEDKIVLSNGVVLQAFGRGQSLRGVKHLDKRPDRCYGDDMEDEESVKTPEARKKFSDWFMLVVLPALAPDARVRILGTPLDPESFVTKLAKLKNWYAQHYPIEYIGESGERIATWASRFPLTKIDEIKEEYRQAGALHAFAQEYMLEPEDPTQKKFTDDMIKVEPTVRTWHPTLAVYDPARTTNKTSATTGHIVGSWLGSRLVIWEGDGRFLMPDEIINDMFRVHEQYSPQRMGVEQDGLNEFILQPLRQEQTKRRCLLPIYPLSAPKGKIPFIESLQPFFKAHEIVFAVELPELRRQLLSFPTGRIDAPNALAYFLRMRPGLPIYDGFNAQNVMENLAIVQGRPAWLAVNAKGQLTTALLVQLVDGALHVVADWVREGDPGAVLRDIVQEASLEARASLRACASAKHFQAYDTVGLLAAARKIPLDVSQGGAEAQGREEMRSLFRRVIHGRSAVLVSMQARWTLNALAGGYCRAVLKTGVLSEFAEEGPYKILCEGFESFAALLHSARLSDTEGHEPNYAFTDRGVRYLTALPRGR